MSDTLQLNLDPQNILVVYLHGIIIILNLKFKPSIVQNLKIRGNYYFVGFKWRRGSIYKVILNFINL